nr:speckle-type POZ protein-like isoform X1 [Parasteatoda tepidariorum]XP_042905553.1 speckle-type POZ protein-like isoform X2 [Parasteatoda tepidariorum]
MGDATKHNQCIFTWKIKNFLSCRTAYDERILSPTFYAANLPVKTWELKLFPLGNSGDNNYCKYKTIAYLFRKQPDNYSKSIVLDVTLGIHSVDGSVLKTEEKKSCKLSKNGHWGCNFGTTEELRRLMKNWSQDTIIIRCVMTNVMSEKEYKVQCIESEAVTIVDVDRFTFKWHVSNVGCFDWSENISDPNSILPNLKIDLIAAADEVVKIRIQMLDKSSENETVLFRMKFLSSSGIQLASMCELHLFDSTKPWVLPTLISIKSLSTGNSWPPSYNYTFISECIISKKTTSWSKIENLSASSIVKKESTTLPSFSSSLQHDFRELFLSKKHSDVKLRVNNIDFLAHKAVLASRSPVFSAMFDQDMLENQSGIVQIKDLNEKTLQNLLEFMYTDVVNEMDCEGTLNLLLAADKYQVLNLKDKCTSKILSLLSEENVCEVITVADMINHESLKTIALNFILEKASKILSAPNWCLWVEENMRLASEILVKLSKYLKSENNYSVGKKRKIPAAKEEL